jgi:hypothetical protein
MNERLRAAGWAGVFALLVVLSVPWFLWGDGRVAAGLPLWLWWHIGWMVVATAVFWSFTRTGWDRYLGVHHG